MAKDIEFHITTDLTTIGNTIIEANFDEVKAKMTEMMIPYASLIVTEDGIGAAKTDRADIRKIKARIDEYRKTVKQVYTAPVVAFEAKCKELTAICDNAANNLDGQIKAFENTKKEEKMAVLREFFEMNKQEAADYITWEQAQNPRWANATYSEENAKKDILDIIQKTIEGVNAIRSLRSDFETVLMDMYRQNHNITECITTNDRLRQAREREIRRRAELKEKAEAEGKTPEQIARENRVKAAWEAEKNEPRLTVRFEISATREQLSGLRAYMRGHDIVPKEVK